MHTPFSEQDLEVGLLGWGGGREKRSSKWEDLYHNDKTLPVGKAYEAIFWPSPGRREPLIAPDSQQRGSIFLISTVAPPLFQHNRNI